MNTKIKNYSLKIEKLEKNNNTKQKKKNPKLHCSFGNKKK